VLMSNYVHLILTPGNPDFAGFLAAREQEDPVMRRRKAEQIGRPVGDSAFLDRLEGKASRSLRTGPTPR